MALACIGCLEYVELGNFKECYEFTSLMLKSIGCNYAPEGNIMSLNRYVIERDVPGIGGLDAEQLSGAACASNDALAQLAPRVQWEHSYVAGDKTFCVYLAEDEDVIRKHAELSGFPATRITPIRTMIDPTTGRSS
jgi:hypothetical protein